MSGVLPEARASIENAEQWLAALRAIARESGVSAAQIGIRAGVPRSTAYWFINPKNTAVPAVRDYVRRFLVACGATPEVTAAMLGSWDHLRAISHLPRTRLSAAAAARGGVWAVVEAARTRGAPNVIRLYPAELEALRAAHNGQASRAQFVPYREDVAQALRRRPAETAPHREGRPR